MAKNLTIKNRNIRIQIWDTAGQEAFRSITRTYYKSSTCAFIVYDISDKKTFDDVITWLNECRVMCYKDIVICCPEAIAYYNNWITLEQLEQRAKLLEKNSYGKYLLNIVEKDKLMKLKVKKDI